WATPPVHGCLTEEVVHPAAYTYKLPDSLSFAEGALIEPFAVGMYAATKAGIAPGDVAAVVGSGTIGIMTAIAARAGGASRIYISDVQPEKLGLLEGMEGIIPVDATKEDLGDRVRAETGGWGPQVVFEASGAAPAYKDLWSPGPGRTHRPGRDAGRAGPLRHRHRAEPRRLARDRLPLRERLPEGHRPRGDRCRGPGPLRLGDLPLRQRRRRLRAVPRGTADGCEAAAHAVKTGGS